MKYWGRSLIVHLAIIAILYGTKDAWDIRTYNAYVGAQGHDEPEGYKRSQETLAIVGGLGGEPYGKGLGGGTGGYR